MKSKFACILAALLLAATPVSVYAAGTTTLTTTVPTASYTLNIPADMEIPFGQVETEIGTVTVSDADGFAVGKNLQVTLTYDEFECDDVNTTIPYEIQFINDFSNRATIFSGQKIIFSGQNSGDLEEKFHYINETRQHVYTMGGLICHIASIDWGKALAGEYSTTITFTAEVVSE